MLLLLHTLIGNGTRGAGPNLSTSFNTEHLHIDGKQMKSPEFVCHAGKGHFSFRDSAVESPFMLYRNPYWIGVIAEGFSYETAIMLIKEQVPIQLTGILNDGRLIKADPLLLTKLNPPGNIAGVEFTAIDGVSLGQEVDIPPIKSMYPMTGCFKGEIALTHDGWEITTILCTESDIAKDLVEKWRIPVEGMTLQLKRDGSSMVQHRDFARVVMILLSLALGTGVACDRHVFTWANEELEIWQQWTGDEIGPGAIIPDYQLVNFLEQALPAWLSLSPNQQKAVRLARDYINLSARGYVDTRILQIFQPWEFLVDAWEIKGKLSESESCLRSRLLKARTQWNQDYSNCDVHGFWGSRISVIFEWPKLKDAIIQLANSFGLDFKLVGLDLDLLIEARNSVVHSGKLALHPIVANKNSSDLLKKGQYCLQLLIMQLLRYRGTVNHSRNGVISFVDIEEALISART